MEHHGRRSPRALNPVITRLSASSPVRSRVKGRDCASPDDHPIFIRLRVGAQSAHQPVGCNYWDTALTREDARGGPIAPTGV